MENRFARKMQIAAMMMIWFYICTKSFEQAVLKLSALKLRTGAEGHMRVKVYQKYDVARV